MIREFIETNIAADPHILNEERCKIRLTICGKFELFAGLNFKRIQQAGTIMYPIAEFRKRNGKWLPESLLLLDSLETLEKETYFEYKIL